MEVDWGLIINESECQNESFCDSFSNLSTQECTDMLKKQQSPVGPAQKDGKWEIDYEYLRKLEARLEKIQKPKKKIGQDMLKQLHDRTEMLFSTNDSMTTANHLTEILADHETSAKAIDSRTLIKNDGLEQKHKEEHELKDSGDSHSVTTPTASPHRGNS